tara:strand:+ start:2646 stop:3134 length:489 start_codon:yes stop_codon:yes gene_type:complete
MYYDDKKECTISFNSSNHVSKFIRDQSFFGNSFDSIDGCSSTAVYTSASVTGPAGLNIRFHLDELGDLGKDWFEVEILQNIVNLQIILDTLNPADTITSDYRLTTHGDFNAAGSLFAKKVRICYLRKKITKKVGDTILSSPTNVKLSIFGRVLNTSKFLLKG